MYKCTLYTVNIINDRHSVDELYNDHSLVLTSDVYTDWLYPDPDPGQGVFIKGVGVWTLYCPRTDT